MEKEQLAQLMGKFACKKLKTGNIRTSPFRMSYPNLFEKSSSNDGEFAEKYGVTLLFPKGANLKLLHDAIEATAAAKFGPKVVMKTLRLPFRDQGTKDKVGYEPGAEFFRANSDVRPGILGPDGKPLTDPKDAPAGFWAVATVNPFAYDKKGRGVAMGLQNVAIIAADETFGAMNADAHEEFADVLDGAADAAAMFEQEADADQEVDFG